MCGTREVGLRVQLGGQDSDGRELAQIVDESRENESADGVRESIFCACKIDDWSRCEVDTTVTKM